MRSPRCPSVCANAPCPRVPRKGLRVPEAGPGAASPSPETGWEHVTFHRRSECLGFFPQRRKFHFSEMGWDRARWALAFAQSLLAYGWFCFWRTAEKGQLSESRVPAGLPPACVLWGGAFQRPDTTASGSPTAVGEAEAGTDAQVPRTTRAGDQGQNKCTGKVERLEDHPGGFHVVIYNGDCKMVNQIWS